MKKLSIYFISIILFLFFIGCVSDNLPTNSTKVSLSVDHFENDIEKIEISDKDMSLLVNRSLEKSAVQYQRDSLVDEILLKYFSMAVAKSLKHPVICQILKEKIGEKFDGDFDVLWDNIKDNQIGSNKLNELVDSRFSDNTRELLSIDIIEKVPLLQVSLPVNFEMWDGESTILVAYTPLSIDDMDWKDIYAYDSDMKEYILDAKTEPDFPVMVVGINERVNPDTRELIFKDYHNILAKIAGTHVDVILDHVYLVNDGEPWTRGSPEIYCLLANSGGISNRYNMYSEWTGWGTNRSWHHVDLNMLEWHEEYSKTFGITFLEYDGGSTITYTLGYNDQDSGQSVHLQFSIKSGDDDLGTASFHKDDAPRTKSNPYSTGSVRFVIDWYEYTI